MTIPVRAQLNNTTVKDNTILVKGTAVLKQIPELLSASLSLKSESRDYTDCQDRAIAKLDKVKAALLNHNINEKLLHTGEIRITETIELQGGKPVKNGFSATILLTLEAPYTTGLTQNLLDALRNDSLSVNYTIGFKLSESQKSALRQQAITMAIDDAREKATLIAKSANVKLGRINSVTYLDEEMTWNIDRDIIREVSGVFTTVGQNSPSPMIEFSPKEIGLIKGVRIEWMIER